MKKFVKQHKMKIINFGGNIWKKIKELSKKFKNKI